METRINYLFEGQYMLTRLLEWGCWTEETRKEISSQLDAVKKQITELEQTRACCF